MLAYWIEQNSFSKGPVLKQEVLHMIFRSFESGLCIAASHDPHAKLQCGHLHTPIIGSRMDYDCAEVVPDTTLGLNISMWKMIGQDLFSPKKLKL